MGIVRVASVALLVSVSASCGSGSGAAAGRWGTAEQISPLEAGGDAEPPAVAIDANGGAIVLWPQKPEGTIWAARRQPRGAWESPIRLDTQGPTSYRSTPIREVAMDAAGDALAVWSRSDGSVWASWSVLDAPWTTPVRLTDPGEVGAYPKVALDPAGDGFAVWQTGRGSAPAQETRIRARRVSRGGWELVQDIQLSYGETGGSPQVAVSRDGNAVAVWYELHRGVYRIWANSYQRMTGWGAAEPISPNQSHEGAGFPDVGADALGGAMAVWARSPGGPLREIEARRFDVAHGWGPVASVASVAADRLYTPPRVAVDASGNALLIWLEDGGGYYELWAAWFAVGEGWGPAQRLQSAVAPAYDVAMDARGTGMALWARREGDRRVVWTSHFQPSGGWGAHEAIGTELLGPTVWGQVAIALSPIGDGIAAWQQWDGTRMTIWANRFAAVDAAPAR